MICFVTDGGRQIGMGHIQQSITLARELQLQRKNTILFVTKSNEIILESIRNSGFEGIRLQDDIQIFKFLEELNPDIIIFDKIDVDERFAKKIRIELEARLVIFTNLTKANDHAHIAVLPRAKKLHSDPKIRFKNISYLNRTTNTLYFYGPKYWILRREFFQYKKRSKLTVEGIERILLTFGGSDPTNLTCAVLQKLLEIDSKYYIDVVMGDQFVAQNEVANILNIHSDKKPNVSLHNNVKNMAELMHIADLAIIAAGMTMFEAFCIGTPVIVIPQDQLQRDTYRGVVRMIELDELSDLERMIETADFTNSNDSNIIDMNVGLGLQELVDAILLA